MLDVVNLVSFADLNLKQKTPKTTQQQIADLKELIATYNGKAPDFDNVLCLMVDAGSGGVSRHPGRVGGRICGGDCAVGAAGPVGLAPGSG